MIPRSLARRYARSLVSVARAKECLDRVATEVRGPARAGGEPLRAFVESPIHHEKAKVAVLHQILAKQHPAGIHEITKNFFATLELHHRVKDYYEILVMLDEAVDKALGVVRAEVTTATQLEGDATLAVQTALAAVTGKKVKLRATEDPAIIGGVVTRIGSTVYDGSVKTRLAGMRANLAAQTQGTH